MRGNEKQGGTVDHGSFVLFLSVYFVQFGVVFFIIIINK